MTVSAPITAALARAALPISVRYVEYHDGHLPAGEWLIVWSARDGKTRAVECHTPRRAREAYTGVCAGLMGERP